jgi:hypothetical protein
MSARAVRAARIGKAFVGKPLLLRLAFGPVDKCPTCAHCKWHTPDGLHMTRPGSSLGPSSARVRATGLATLRLQGVSFPAGGERFSMGHPELRTTSDPRPRSSAMFRCTSPGSGRARPPLLRFARLGRPASRGALGGWTACEAPAYANPTALEVSCAVRSPLKSARHPVGNLDRVRQSRRAPLGRVSHVEVGLATARGFPRRPCIHWWRGAVYGPVSSHSATIQTAG